MVVFSAVSWVIVGSIFILSSLLAFRHLKKEGRLIKKILSEFESREKKRNQKEILNFSIDLIKKNSKVKSLYSKLILFPKNGSPDQRIQRSYVLRELLRITQSRDVTSMIAFLADKESRKIIKASQG